MQIWRPITCLICLGAFSFNWMFNAYFAYFAMSRVETDLFGRDDYADFLWLVVYLWLGLVSIGVLLSQPLISSAFTFAMLYIWCKRRPFETITFFFGIKVKSNRIGERRRLLPIRVHGLQRPSRRVDLPVRAWTRPRPPVHLCQGYSESAAPQGLHSHSRLVVRSFAYAAQTSSASTSRDDKPAQLQTARLLPPPTFLEDEACKSADSRRFSQSLMAITSGTS